METDRLHHFFWEAQDDPQHPYHREFWRLYREIDSFVGELVARLPNDCELVILSDHGFCQIEYEVELNALLRERGFLRFANGAATNFSELHSATRAFALIPGRLYLTDFSARDELTQMLSELTDPQGRPVIAAVLSRDQIYSGAQLARAAHLIAVPYNGFDLKARLNAQQLFVRTHLQGMHTFDDAFLFVRNHKIAPDPKPRLIDLAPTLCTLCVGSSPDEVWEGRSLL